MDCGALLFSNPANSAESITLSLLCRLCTEVWLGVCDFVKGQSKQPVMEKNVCEGFML